VQAFTGAFNTKPFSKDFFNLAGKFDITYFLIVIGLVVFGLVTHYSASYHNLKQLVCAIAGIVIMLVIANISVKVYRDCSSAFIGICTILLFLVFTRTDYNGTHRWFFFFQPSEIAKIALIMFLAYLMDKYKKHHDTAAQFFIFLGITGAFGVLILAESHLSGAILFLCIGYAMMWYAGMSKKWFFIITAAIVFVLLVIIWKPRTLLMIPGIKEYQVNRIIIWKKILGNGEITAKERINDARQILQSLYGIGSGGLFGVGFGQSGQKVSNLSEKANDFIFAVLAEEGGFIAAVFMLFLFGWLVYRGFRIALESRTYFGALLVLGISTQMALQVLINVAVATSVLPNTGISLPFFSEGGTSLMFSLASMGLVLGVSKDKRKSKPEVKQNAES
ncbi:MAG: FtsW/RodA/SpoVE family cell cycle protein, partial [Clostridia bacterium]|nr:FtsW/RodA/SpoVE family cell cycle protein [Clostridia bacterium]